MSKRKTAREKIWEIPKPEFEKLLKENPSFEKLTIYFGFSNAEHIAKIIRQRTGEENIDISYFMGIYGRKFTKYTLEQIMVENSTYRDNSRFKKRLFREGLKTNVCEWCGIGPKWNNKPMTLQLDHINGIRPDNRLENIRVLCRNCHAITSTYMGRNRHNNTEIKPNKRCIGGKLKDILIKGDKRIHGQPLKNRLVREDLMKNMCNECGQPPKWRDKYLILELDHINGDCKDNRLENLRVLCPNCHATTKTYCRGLQKKKEPNRCKMCNKEISRISKICQGCYLESVKRKSPYEPKKQDYTKKSGYCEECGVKISMEANMCRSCSAIKNNSIKRKIKNRPSKIQLCKDVEEFGYWGTGRKYGVTDNTIRRWLKAKCLMSQLNIV